jgi:hypothetical protein
MTPPHQMSLKAISRTSSHALHEIMPPRNTLQYQFPQASTQQLGTAVESVLGSISDVLYEEVDSSNPTFVTLATTNTWSRAARRGHRPLPIPSDHNAKYSITVKDVVLDNSDNSGRGRVLEFQWLQGRDRPLYESFCSHVSRKVALELERRLGKPRRQEWNPS